MYLLELWTNLNREPLRSQTHSFTEIGTLPWAQTGGTGAHGPSLSLGEEQVHRQQKLGWY